MRKLPIDDIARLTPEGFRQAPKPPLCAVLDNIRSRTNVGSIFRSADAFRLAGLQLCGITPRPPHRDIRKTALGAEEAVAWTGYPEAGACAAALLAGGWTLAALEHTDDTRLLADAATNLPPKLALVLGNEVEGVSEDLLAQCAFAIEIPQFGTKHSLNVGVAAGIAFYELSRGYGHAD